MTGRYYNIVLIWFTAAVLVFGTFDVHAARRRRGRSLQKTVEQVEPEAVVESRFATPLRITVPRSVTDALEADETRQEDDIRSRVLGTQSAPNVTTSAPVQTITTQPPAVTNADRDAVNSRASKTTTISPQVTAPAATTAPALTQEPTTSPTPKVSAPENTAPIVSRNNQFENLNIPVVDPLRKQLLQEEEWGSEKIELNFKEADLVNVLQYMEKLFKVSFIANDVIKPLAQGAVGTAGHKLTFTTHVPFSRRQVWDTLIVFLELSGLTLVRVSDGIYRVVGMSTVNQAAIPSFIGADPEMLPDNDMVVRYVYFLENIGIDEVFNIMGSMASPTALVKKLDDLNAVFISDKSANIKSLMRVVRELDRDVPEAMSVLRLKRADAKKVKALYEELTKAEDPKGLARLMGAKKQPSSFYFPIDTRMVVEPRTNSLILLGSKQALEKVEKFIIEFADGAFDLPEFPLYVHELQYANATSIANILQQVTAFSPSSSAAQFGTVINGEKYFRQPVSVIPEPSGNRLIVRCDREDYPHIHSLIKQLDVKQPQVGIEVLIVDVDETNATALGAQLRNKWASSDVNWQNSGLPVGSAGSAPPQVDPNTGSLVTSLIGLASPTLQTAGTALLTIGNELTNGVWAIFKILRSKVQTNIIQNPFLVTTNKYTATVSIGEIRRVVTGTVQGATATTDAFGDKPAKLTLNITPQISGDGIIQLTVRLTISQFTNASPTDATVSTRIVNTIANVGDNQVLALGGFIKTKRTDIETKLPFLGDIPILGWLFKNKRKNEEVSHLLVFIAPRRMDTCKDSIEEFTRRKAEYSANILDYEANELGRNKDPFNRWLFKENTDKMSSEIDNFMSQRHFSCAHPIDMVSEKEIADAWLEKRKPTHHCGCCSEVTTNHFGGDAETVKLTVDMPEPAVVSVPHGGKTVAVPTPVQQPVVETCVGPTCVVNNPPAGQGPSLRERSSLSKFFAEERVP